MDRLAITEIYKLNVVHRVFLTIFCKTMWGTFYLEGLCFGDVKEDQT